MLFVFKLVTSVKKKYTPNHPDICPLAQLHLSSVKPGPRVSAPSSQQHALPQVSPGTSHRLWAYLAGDQASPITGGRYLLHIPQLRTTSSTTVVLTCLVSPFWIRLALPRLFWDVQYSQFISAYQRTEWAYQAVTNDQQTGTKSPPWSIFNCI